MTSVTKRYWKLILPVYLALLAYIFLWHLTPPVTEHQGKHITAAQARKLAVCYMEKRTKAYDNIGVDRIEFENEEWRIGASILPSGPARLAIMTLDNWGNVTMYVPCLE